GLAECEIEDLFDSKILEMKIDGKSFERNLKDFNDTEHYGKAIFADYILKNYHAINFDNFRPFLDCLNKIVES
ncbi:RNA-directed DNA polymerase, partial [Enterococcus faecalis]|nr:RNA-directed DNA polymerase [Enterococcus faecalis]